jgi:hypothetical protein
MTTPVFSINGAAELLERDRRSVQKSLRHVQPDKLEKGQPRWRLPTILRALDQLPSSSTAPRRRASNVTSASDDDEFTRTFKVAEAFTRASDAIVALEKTEWDEMPDEKADAFRKVEGRKAFEKIEALRAVFEEAEQVGPGGKLSEELSNVLGQMFRGVLHACGMILVEDDEKTACFPDEQKKLDALRAEKEASKRG